MRPLVALGGGRVVEVAKAVGSVSGTEVVAVPTTLSGAPMTAIHRLPEGAEDRVRGMVRPRAEVWMSSSDGRMLAEIHAHGEVLDQRTEGDQLVVRARLPEKLRGRLEQAGARITTAV